MGLNRLAGGVLLTVLISHGNCFAAPEPPRKSSTNEKPTSLDEIYHSLNSKKIAPKTSKKNVLKIPIEKMAEFDFKSRDEILRLRREQVEKYFEEFRALYWRLPGSTPDEKVSRELFEKAYPRDIPVADEPYVPSEAVFKRMESKKPWWGIHGISYYGPGYRAVAGPSEESRFILNPYLFVGIVENSAQFMHGSALPPRAIYAKATRLQFNLNQNRGFVVYDVRSYLKLAEVYGHKQLEYPFFRIVAYNARDFRFSYIALDIDRTQNVEFPANLTMPQRIGQFIAVGGSCDFPEGCNNMTSDTDPLKVRVRKLPAVIHAKLWQTRPEEIEQKPDFEFRIHLR